MAETDAQQQVKIEETTAVHCTTCGNEFFEEVILLRKIPAEKAPSKKEEIHPVKTIVCARCRKPVQ